MNIDINKNKFNFDDLDVIMSVLLGENGCPWDRAQTHESVMECLLEECYEVIDAVKKKDRSALCEELGDILLQVVFNAKLSENNKGFDISDVIDGISKKMISRHTHIFGSSNAENKEQVIDIWEENKRKEKGFISVKDSMESIPKSFPALLRAQKVQKKALKASRINMALSDIIDDTVHELLELKALTSDEDTSIIDKYSDILFKITNISLVLKINPELALTNAIETYINKFENFDFASEGN